MNQFLDWYEELSALELLAAFIGANLVISGGCTVLLLMIHPLRRRFNALAGAFVLSAVIAAIALAIPNNRPHSGLFDFTQYVWLLQVPIYAGASLLVSAAVVSLWRKQSAFTKPVA